MALRVYACVCVCLLLLKTYEQVSDDNDGLVLMGEYRMQKNVPTGGMRSPLTENNNNFYCKIKTYFTVNNSYFVCLFVFVFFFPTHDHNLHASVTLSIRVCIDSCRLRWTY